MSKGHQNAFPLHLAFNTNGEAVTAGSYGLDQSLTKQEYFYAAALTGLLANIGHAGEDYDQTAVRAMRHADAAMNALQAREKADEEASIAKMKADQEAAQAAYREKQRKETNP